MGGDTVDIGAFVPACVCLIQANLCAWDLPDPFEQYRVRWILAGKTSVTQTFQ